MRKMVREISKVLVAQVDNEKKVTFKNRHKFDKKEMLARQIFI